MPLYVTIGSNRLSESIPFYKTLLESVGWRWVRDKKNGGCFFGDNQGALFAVVTPFNGEPATAGNGTMTGFSFGSTDEVDTFHMTAMNLGARNEGDPGYRGDPELEAYFAYVRDLEGNKLCAFNWSP